MYFLINTNINRIPQEIIQGRVFLFNKQRSPLSFKYSSHIYLIFTISVVAWGIINCVSRLQFISCQLFLMQPTRNLTWLWEAGVGSKHNQSPSKEVVKDTSMSYVLMQRVLCKEALSRGGIIVQHSKPQTTKGVEGIMTNLTAAPNPWEVNPWKPSCLRLAGGIKSWVSPSQSLSTTHSLLGRAKKCPPSSSWIPTRPFLPSLCFWLSP